MLFRKDGKSLREDDFINFDRSVMPDELFDPEFRRNYTIAPNGQCFDRHSPGIFPQMLDELIAEGLPVLPMYLSSSVRMRESHQACQPLIHFDPRHKLTQQFVELHDYLDQNA